jgi:hypothetical protein
VAALQDLERAAGSPGEEEAARWLGVRLADAGARDVRVEEEDFRPGYAVLLAALERRRRVSGRRRRRGTRPAARGRRRPGAAAAIADDVANGPRLAARPSRDAGRRGTSSGGRGPGATRLLVVLAHHDAAPSGFIFHPGPGEWVGRRFPHVLDRANTSVPLWWPVILGPALAGLGALSAGAPSRRGRPELRRSPS